MINVYQIYYDSASASQIDPLFIPLENKGNPRADWREYWPIRNFFLNNDVNKDELYGFFSPNFRNKTSLTGEQVFEFIADNPNQDVYTFSPFVQEASCYLNTFEQGNRHHPGLLSVSEQFLKTIDVDIHFESIIMDFRNSIFCNYFIAKPSFWKKWFIITEKLFNCAENGNDELSIRLASSTRYSKGPVDMKVFIMERICSLILALDNIKSVANYDISRMPWAYPLYYPYREELFTLNALKLAYSQTSQEVYLRQFYELRKRVLIKCDPTFTDKPDNGLFG